MEIRTTLPDYGDPFYNNGYAGGYSDCITGSPTCPGRNVLSNCVGWANSRFNEIIAREKGINYMNYQFTCNAENFTDRANEYGIPISPVPVVGGIMVWEGLGSLAGHVAIVERIDNANQIFTSESGWNCDYFWNATRTNDNGNWGMNGNYRFKGCITNPALRSHLQYKGHIQNIGWTDWMDSGQLCGTTGQNLRLEGLKIKSDKYDIYAMAHIQDYGWQDYDLVDENTIIGTEYEAKRIECIKLKIVNKENGNIAGRFKIHMQNYGDSPYTMADGVCTLGSVGQALRIEGITIEEI